MVLEIDNKKLVVYDLENKKELFDLPIQNNFIDLSIGEQGQGVVAGCDEDAISFYGKDGDEKDKRLTFLCSFQYHSLEGKIDIKDRLYGYISWRDCEWKFKTCGERYMNHPRYTGIAAKEEGFSAYGNFVIYYSKDANRIVISKYQNGEIFRIFVLAKKYSDSVKFYYNEKSNIFSIFDNSRIEQYIVK